MRDEREVKPRSLAQTEAGKSWLSARRLRYLSNKSSIEDSVS
jgi:hypothetical protein